MPADDSPSLQLLLESLENCWVDLAEAEVDEIVEMLTERQRLLTRLEDFDLGALDAELARRVRLVLTKVVQRDRQLAQKAQQWQSELTDEGTRMRQSRRSAEGYRRVVEATRAALDRTA